MQLYITCFQACAPYYITVTPVMPSGKFGIPANLRESTLDALPGTPENVDAEPYNASCIALTWDAPQSNPYCAYGYSTKCLPTSTKISPISTSSASQESDMRCGLDACTEYVCSVESEDRYGQTGGESSDTTTTAGQPPSQPRNLQAVATGTTSVRLTWSQPTDGFDCMSGYNLTWVNTADTRFNGGVVLPVNAINYDAVGLQPCADYEFTLMGVAGVVGGPATVANSQTEQDVPGPPVNIVSNTTCNTIYVGWDHPLENGGCACKYATELELFGSKTIDTVIISAFTRSDESVTFSGPTVIPNTDYVVTITAENCAGQKGDAAQTAVKTEQFC